MIYGLLCDDLQFGLEHFYASIYSYVRQLNIWIFDFIH